MALGRESIQTSYPPEGSGEMDGDGNGQCYPRDQHGG